ncbi:MAG: Hsp70 family protein [Bifidobacteriaceae bacterium]|jgi:molecular chaperone DnaK (HSP70)|nr:Hsp70 family protein [Bifidobacteriaceae bacterium]
MTDQAYGIDLGTTYSVVALVDETGQAQIIPNFEGTNTTPSVVYFQDSGEVVVGRIAKETAQSDPLNACALIKRHMGAVFPQEFRGTSWTPEGISAFILKELVSKANSQNGLDIKKVVITVPAYFGVQEKEATRQAGVIAGLEVIGIIPEPVAAAISLGTKQEEEQTILVFDLGGGTFDTTVLEAQAGRVKVIAIDGNRLLGGADWDSRLEALYLKKFADQTGLDEDVLRADDEFMGDLGSKIEDAKIFLGRLPEKGLVLRFEGEKANVAVTREEFEAASADLVAQTVEITQRVIETAKGKVAGLAIDRLVLVGGSSRMPMIQAALTAAGFAPEETDFDLSVAKGAAVYAEGGIPRYTGDEEEADSSPGAAPRFSVESGVPSIKVENVLSRGLGVRMFNENDELEIVFLAHQNDLLPLDKSTTGEIREDGQSAVIVPLYEQGGETESLKPEHNNPMQEGEATTISGLTGMRRGDPIEIRLSVSSDGIARLSVTEPKSGRSFTAEASVAVLTPEQVEEIRKEVRLRPTTS